MVIVPNSILSNNQVINYSYPDSRYRIQTHIYVPYNENVEKVRQLLIRAIKNVEGVLAEKPVDVLFVDMTENHVKFRLRWWIDSYEDTRIMFDRVHTNVKIALDQAGIQSPNPIQDINLKIDPLSTDRFSRNFQAKSSEPGNQSESRIDSDGEQNSKFRSDE
jgi:small-conductance mechanosensitive channel